MRYMDMIYGVYMVTRAGVVIKGGAVIFTCDLLGDDNHKLHCQIYFKQSKEELRRYEAIMPYMFKGALLHMEFVYRWYDDGLHLCLAAFKKAAAFRCGIPPEPITVEEYFNVNRGYLARSEVYGEWVQFPGVINLGGEVVIPMNLQASGRPKFLSYLNAKESECALTWTKRTQNLKDVIKNLFCFKR